jgi:S1-C subfamily serine protease
MNSIPALLAGWIALAAAPAPAQEDRETVRKVHQAVGKSFVGIDVSLQKKTRIEKAEMEEDGLDPEIQRLLQIAENQQVLETWGVAVEKDLILMADLKVRASDVAKIEITDASGERFEGRLHAVGRNHDFVLVKPSTPRELAPLEFAAWEAPALGESFYVTFADKADGVWHLNVSPFIQTNAALAPRQEWFCLDSMRRGSVVSDRKGATVGIALDQYLWVLPDGRSSFLGQRLLADERITDLESKTQELARAVPAFVKRVECTLRPEKGPDYMPADDKAGRLVLFGAVIDDRGTLLIPQEVSRDVVRKIEDIAVVEEGRRIPAAFVGSFRAFNGMLVRAEGLAAKPGIVRDAAAPPPGQAFFTATFEDRFGRSRTKVDLNRLFRTEGGLRGALRAQPRKRIKPGAFLLDFEGRLVGFATTDRKEEDIDELAVEAVRERYYDRYRRSFTPDYLRRTVFFSEVADVLANPAAHFDPKAAPMSKKEEKRLVWLGVEFQELSKPLAESLGLQERDLTNDGRRGLLVSAVYPGSPADRAGLRVDDVLLSVQPEGESAARDLIAEQDRYGAYGRYSGGAGSRSPSPWRPAKNYLTSVLTEIGAGKKASFQYVRGQEKRKVEITLEVAPTDFENAERHKDDALGITVKELTYEVRLFQKLDPGISGVVVAKVESGSRAEVAKLQPLSILYRVNGVDVKDLNHFRQLTGSSKGLTFTSILYGQTKLVELARD